ADHHRHHPRGVPADPPAARGGLPGPGRHPLGDDPPGGAAVRPLRHHLRRDARTGPGARGDDGGADGALPGVCDQPLPAAARPAPVDRCEHRQPPTRGRQHRGGRTDRLRPDPVRRDLRREPHRPVGHQPPGRVLRSQLMSVLAPPLPVRRSRKLARWAPYAVLAGSAAFSAGLLALLATVTIAGLFALTAVSYAVAITIISRVVEGPRWAKDRLATALVTLAFLLALIPLVSLLAIVVGDGLGGFSWDFLSTDMVGVFGSMTSGGALHAIIGTVYVTGIASLISIPLGIFTAIYLVEYGQGRLK